MKESYIQTGILIDAKNARDDTIRQRVNLLRLG